VDISDDDTYIAALGKVARRYAEEITGRKFITSTWDVYYNSFGDRLILPFAPLSTITSVKYYDTSSVLQTLDTAYYEAGEYLGIPQIRLKYNQSWPSCRDHEDDIVCRCIFGYGSAGSNVPDAILHAIKLIVGHLYENREPVNLGNITTNLPMTVQALLAPYKIHYPISA
jgi:uncharacterized phiE125 gp8 family phage protein